MTRAELIAAADAARHAYQDGTGSARAWQRAAVAMREGMGGNGTREGGCYPDTEEEEEALRRNFMADHAAAVEECAKASAEGDLGKAMRAAPFFFGH